MSVRSPRHTAARGGEGGDGGVLSPSFRTIIVGVWPPKDIFARQQTRLGNLKARASSRCVFGDGEGGMRGGRGGGERVRNNCGRLLELQKNIEAFALLGRSLHIPPQASVGPCECHTCLIP